MRPGASPQSRGYIYTGPREVSSLVTDLPGTPVTPRIYIYIQKVIEVLHLYRCVTHTYQGVCNHVGSFNEGTTSFPGNSNPLIWLDAQHSFTYPFWSFNRPCVAPAHLKAPAPHRARETAHHETPAAWGFNAAISACDKGGQFTSALRLLDLMSEAVVVPDVRRPRIQTKHTKLVWMQCRGSMEDLVVVRSLLSMASSAHLGRTDIGAMPVRRWVSSAHILFAFLASHFTC